MLYTGVSPVFHLFRLSVSTSLSVRPSYADIHRVSEKNCANFFFSELRQISTNFGKSWQKDGEEAKIMRDALILHLTKFAPPHYRVKRRCSKLLYNAESCYLQ